MDLSGLMARLKGARKSGQGFVACCPAHEDRSPSLSVKDAGNGRLLLHCFGGCDTADVLAAMGLTFADVMPERRSDWRSEQDGSWQRSRRGFTPAEALQALSHESAVMALMAAQVAEGQPISDEDRQRAATAAGRIALALELTA